jgi:glycosyltransferase involved in cell wall biosynthesis
MPPLVTIAIPIYKRLRYLSQGVQAIAAQEYPYIELIVSDNGQNEEKVAEIVNRAYGRPWKFRRNDITVNVNQHYNQILREANGQYFVMVDDDDWISPNFVSDLIQYLEGDQDVAIAMARQIIVDEGRREIGRSVQNIPAKSPGEEFVKGLFEYGFSNYTSFLARTNELRECGGYNDFPRGFHTETAMIVKLALNRSVAFSHQSTFFACRSDASMSRLMDLQQLAEASRLFLEFLESDPWLLDQSLKNPRGWAVLKPRLVNMGWGGYLEKWGTMHHDKLPYLAWVRAGFALPYRPGYYSTLCRGLMNDSKWRLISWAKRWFPTAINLYRSLRAGTSKVEEGAMECASSSTEVTTSPIDEMLPDTSHAEQASGTRSSSTKSSS